MRFILFTVFMLVFCLNGIALENDYLLSKENSAGRFVEARLRWATSQDAITGTSSLLWMSPAITNQVLQSYAVSLTGSYNNPGWLVSLDYSKISNPPTIPTNNNQLTNGAGYITGTGTSATFSGSASPSQVGLGNVSNTLSSGTIQIGNGSITFSNAGQIASVVNPTDLFLVSGTLPFNQISGVPNFITSSGTNAFSFNSGTATYATTSGSANSVAWNDVQYKPTIPTNNNQLTNGAGYVTSSGSVVYATSSGSSSAVDWTGVQNVPTMLSLGISGTNALAATGGTASNLVVLSTSGTSIVQINKGYAGQTSDLQQWQDSAGNVLSKVNASGGIQVPYLLSSSGTLLSYSGTYNVFVGDGGTKITSGQQNAALGSSALFNNVTGNYNTALGFKALLSNTSGASNVAVGVQALMNNTSGGSNTALGSFTLQMNTTGVSNIAIGHLSQASNTSGQNNVAIGYAALSSNTNANYNVAVGSNALSAAKAANNVAIGEGAMQFNTSGAQNVAMGRYALNSGTTGDYNIGLGYMAGRYNTSSNMLFIDSMGRANSADELSKALITGSMTSTGSNQWVNINGSLGVNTGTYPSTSTFTIKSGTSSETPTYSAELTNSGTTGWTLGPGWSGSNSTGFVHTTGTNATLSSTLAPSSGSYYLISTTITNRTAGYCDVFFGGDAKASMTASSTWGIKASTTGTLVINPQATFDGTISVSIKTVSPRTATASILESSGTQSTEIRSMTSGANSLFIGLGSGQYFSGINSTGLGDGALKSVTTSGHLTGIGANALGNNTYGANNTAVGSNALGSNTTGNYNAALGMNALNGNTGGSGNTAVGQSALGNNTTGASNVAVGTGAGAGNTNSGVSIGYYARGQASSGDHNTVMGTFAMYNSLTGGENTAIGSGALNANVNGSSNIAVGRSALSSGTTGSNNIGLGYCAGRYWSGTGMLFIDTYDRTNSAGDLSKALITGSMTSTGTGQWVTINGALTVNSPAAGTTVQINKGYAGQTADLHQWQDSAGNVLARISSSGSTSVPALSITGTSGSSIPATAITGTGTMIFANVTGTLTGLNLVSPNITGTIQGGAVTGGPIIMPYITATNSYAVAASDYIINCVGTFTVTLPTAIGQTGRMLVIKNSGPGVITVTGTLGQLIDNQASWQIPQWNSMSVISTGTSYIIH